MKKFIPRWSPPADLSSAEKRLMARVAKTKKLFGFLRAHRHRIFGDEFQAELEAMYRQTGAGLPPVPPALLAMALLLQTYDKVSDSECVERTVVDARWQMVLDRVGATKPAFAQGSLVAFRNRLIGCDMDRVLLERTARFAHESGAFDPKKLPKHLRIAIDSAPLEGAGRVEDTFNLVAHAARKVLSCAAALLDTSADRVARNAGAPVLLGSSTKAALDVEWSDPKAKAEALRTLVVQVDALEAWVRKRLADAMEKPPLQEHLKTLMQVRNQDLEPDPSGSGLRVRKGVAEDRRVSIEDRDMRHGRKSKSKRFNGYKRHIATDLSTGLVLACAIVPANRPESEALSTLCDDIATHRDGRKLGELHIDRGYISSPLIGQLIESGSVVRCKPWVPRNGDLYTKRDFDIDLKRMTIKCPNGQILPIVLGTTVAFEATKCARCPKRASCTGADINNGRSVRIAHDEPLQLRLTKEIATSTGRARLRERTDVEHRLAHLVHRMGRRARYIGTRKNLLDLRRAAAVQNLETTSRSLTLQAMDRAA